MVNDNPLTRCAVVAAAALTTTSAFAVEDDRWYVAPAVSYVIADDDREADDGFGLMLGLGKPLSESWNIELSLVGDTLDLEEGDGEYEQVGVQVDGLYFFNRGGWAPYGLIGAGALRTDVADDDETNLMSNVGLGLMKQLGGVSLRGDVRYRLDYDDRNDDDFFGDWLINVALLVPFGGKSEAPAPEPAPAPVAPPAPVDSDGDGVVDDADSCPNTPAGAAVDSRGCELDSDDDGVVNSRDECPATPAGRSVNAMGCEPDSDGDGVVDAEDRCPATPRGAAVDVNGCELDDDGDGVVNSKDACPDSKPGAKVDSRGCELADVIVLEGVNFETASANLTEDSKGILDDMAATLRKYATMVVEVAGHTDSRGAVAYNRRLSEQRAQSVRDYLVLQGVGADNLRVKGYGPDQPIADNATAEGRAQNRRVELKILER